MLTGKFATGSRQKHKGAQARDVFALLKKQQGTLVWRRRYEPVDELVITILSQHTSDLNAERAYRALKAKFARWDEVADAAESDIEETIRTAGLSKQKAPRIRQVLRIIREMRGELDLEFLKDLPLAEAKQWLMALPGVGPKTAAVVLCFALGMPAMAVDTHVYRVSKRLGLIGPNVDVNKAHDLLEAMVPAVQVYPFHVYLIMHGRRVCKALPPRCGDCVLNAICPSSLVDGKTSVPAKLTKQSGRVTVHGAPLVGD